MGIRKNALKKSNDSNTLLEIEDIIKMAKSSGYINGYALDIEAVISRHKDIKVEKVDMSPEESGSLQKKGSVWILSVNNAHHINRQRFTLAHEYGHYCMHKGKQDVFTDEVFFRNSNNDSMEYAANLFAASILMPEAEFRALVSKGTTRIQDLANLFKVSAMAIKIRVKQLGY